MISIIKASNYFCDFCGRVQSHDSGLLKQSLEREHYKLLNSHYIQYKIPVGIFVFSNQLDSAATYENKYEQMFSLTALYHIKKICQHFFSLFSIFPFSIGFSFSNNDRNIKPAGLSLSFGLNISK